MCHYLTTNDLVYDRMKQFVQHKCLCCKGFFPFCRKFFELILIVGQNRHSLFCATFFQRILKLLKFDIFYNFTPEMNHLVPNMKLVLTNLFCIKNIDAPCAFLCIIYWLMLQQSIRAERPKACKIVNTLMYQSMLGKQNSA